jgi:hypothetical protein
MNGIKGRFLPGYLPALKQPMEADNYLRQVGAAYALARAARFCGEERFAVRASQAILALLEDTKPDPRDSMSRCLTLPSAMVNHLGAAGALVLAINELPSPQKDLLDRSEELCRYIARQVHSDGSLLYQDTSAKPRDGDGIEQYPGLALTALLASHKHRPAPWKVEMVRKAMPYYRAWWKEHRSLDFVCQYTPAFAQAYLLTKDKALADFVFEMNDWVCTLQYTQLDPRRPGWYGGFMSYQNGHPVENEPTVASACQAECLIEACRATREAGDADRYQSYTEAIERALQMLTTLQYTEARTYHFEKWFRPQILGAFHASHLDGNLRIDYTQHAVAAVFGYLEYVVR